jgi:hypothetical protein
MILIDQGRSWAWSIISGWTVRNVLDFLDEGQAHMDGFLCISFIDVLPVDGGIADL